MKVSENCIKLIEHFEGCYLKAYKCPAGVWTIGIGTTLYANGIRVKEGDEITIEQAYQELYDELEQKAETVDSYTRDTIEQYEFDSLCSFAYNVGLSALKNSRLLIKVNANAPEAEISKQFNRWIYGGGQILPGLVRRRLSEAYLYNTGFLKFEFV